MKRPHRSLAEFLLALPLLAFALWCSLQSPDLTWFNGHMSRDWVRAQDWAKGIGGDWGGPELNYKGGRLFGPAFYLWLAALVKVSGNSLLWVLSLHHALALIPSLLLTMTLRRDLGRAAAWVFFLSYFLMPIHVSVERSLWNPSLVPALNSLTLLTLRSAWKNPERTSPLIALTLLGWIGIQVHLSTLPLWLAGWLWLVIHGPPERRRKLYVTLVTLLGYAVAFKTLRQETPAYLQSLRSQYEWRALTAESLSSYVYRWWGHFHLHTVEIGDFEIFPVILGYLQFLWPDWQQVLLCFEGFGCLWWALVALLLFWPGSSSASFYPELLRLWLGLAAVGMWFYNIKGGVLPYRYGLMIYPGQFLLPALAMARPLRGGAWLKTLLALGSLVVFCGNASYLVLSYRVMATVGRASHVAMDAHELPLRYKLLVLSVGMRQGSDPYDFLHGPLVNKLRTHEGERELDRFYHGLQRSLGANPAVNEGRHLVVRSFTPDELRENAGRAVPCDPFHFEELTRQDLPEELILQSGAQRIRTEWGELLLPLNRLGPVESFSVHARWRRLRPGFLRICYDDCRGFSTLRLELLRLNQRQLEASPAWAGWLCQSVVTVPVGSGDSVLELGFRVEHPERWGSRLDLFITPDRRPFAPLQSLSPFDEHPASNSR